MEDIRILEEQLPIIKINNEDVKDALSLELEKYKGIIVTEETLQGCKATQKELAGLKNKIDTYRKEKKATLSKPITEFESTCKELISLIETVERPIKDGIKVFDDRRKEEKRQNAENLRLKVIEEQELNEKYAMKLELIEKYSNLTAKESDVEADLNARAFALKVEQDREKELLDIVEDCINTENKRLVKKMQLDDFKRIIGAGVDTRTILQEIKLRADVIHAAENPTEEPEEERVVAIAPEPVKNMEPENDPLCFALYRVTGNLSELRKISAFLKANNITYSVVDQGKINEIHIAE